MRCPPTERPRQFEICLADLRDVEEDEPAGLHAFATLHHVVRRRVDSGGPISVECSGIIDAIGMHMFL